MAGQSGMFGLQDCKERGIPGEEKVTGILRGMSVEFGYKFTYLSNELNFNFITGTTNIWLNRVVFDHYDQMWERLRPELEK